MSVDIVTLRAVAQQQIAALDLSEAAIERLFSQALCVLEPHVPADEITALLEQATLREGELLASTKFLDHYIIQPVAGYLIQPSDGPELVTGTGVGGFELKTAPKLQQLLTALHHRGIRADDCLIYQSTTKANAMRQLPYMLIDIPRLERQIAICDQIGEITFVSDKLLSLSDWAGSTKDELKANPAINAVRYDAAGKWLGEVLDLTLGDRTVAQTLKVKIKAGRRSSITLAVIKEWMWATYQKTNEWPMATSKFPVFTRNSISGELQEVPDERWSAIYTNLIEKARQLPAGYSLEKLRSEVASDQGIELPAKLSTRSRPNLTIPIIKEWMWATYQKMGEWPDAHSKFPVFTQDPETNLFVEVPVERWGNIRVALEQGGRGLTPGQASLSTIRKEVADEQGIPLSLNLVAAFKQDLTIEIIKEWIWATYQAEGKWPTQTSDFPVYSSGEQIVPNESWINIVTCLNQGRRGLPEKTSFYQLKLEVALANNLPEPPKTGLKAFARRSADSSNSSPQP